MSFPHRGRGRLNNGLDAILWAPLRDVDPRVGEHLLEVLREAGIAAYLEPTADVGPYTRTVSLPSPPSDRLFVDRARVREGREVVEQHVDEHAGDRGRGARTERISPRRDLDEDAEWARIVAGYEGPDDRSLLDEEPVDAPPPPPAEVPVLDRPDEHFEPPPAPPVPLPSPATLYSVLLVAAGLLLITAPRLVGLAADIGLLLGVGLVIGGSALLVSRMRERAVGDGDDDDGAVV